MSDNELPVKLAIIPVTDFQQNCSIIWCTKTMQGVVIDPGGDVENILHAISETGVDVKHILLTHGHFDHAGGAAELKQKLGVDIIGPHKGDKFLLESLEEYGSQFGMSGIRNCQSDKWLDDGDELQIGDVTLKVLHCPGHTPGSVVFVIDEIELAIVGDVLFHGSIGRTDLPGGNHEQLLASIRNRLLTLDDGFSFISGHGPASTIGNERANNPFLQA